jgi:hypothetical protein
MKVLIIQIFFQCFMAVFIYYGIVKRRRLLPISSSKSKDDTTNTKKEITADHRWNTTKYTLPIESYLFGWGIVIPLSFYIPYCIVYVFHIQNKSIKLSTATTTFIVAFRCIEAMYHTSPHTVEYNINTYLIYYSSLLHFQWNHITHKRRKIRIVEFIHNTLSFIGTLILLSIVLSYEMHYNFEPFVTPIRQIDNVNFTLDIFHIGHILNMYLLAILTYLTLSFGLEITGIGEQVKGYYTNPIFHNPLFTSRSPSDFWSRKWNNMIHTILKYGTFYPAQQYLSKRMALLLTFAMSGLMHEYVWTLIFYHHPDDDKGEEFKFIPQLSKVTAFFTWNGIIMLLERPLTPYIRPISSKLPTIVVSTLVVLTALPVSHWYTGDWVVGGVFRNLSLGCWTIRKV